jgi:glutathione peroxidase
MHVIGQKQHPLFAFLSTVSGYTPQWNFSKYLFDEKGQFLNSYASAVAPISETFLADLNF